MTDKCEVDKYEMLLIHRENLHYFRGKYFIIVVNYILLFIAALKIFSNNMYCYYMLLFALISTLSGYAMKSKGILFKGWCTVIIAALSLILCIGGCIYSVLISHWARLFFFLGIWYSCTFIGQQLYFDITDIVDSKSDMKIAEKQAEAEKENHEEKV